MKIANKIEVVDINSVKLNDDNPRSINDKNYKKLVKSIKNFPEMMDIRPIVVDKSGVALGGNMRLRACIDAGLKEVPVIRADKLTEKQKKEFIIKDNLSFGEWDYDILCNDWNMDDLTDWGLDIDDEKPEEEEEEEKEKSYKFTINCADEVELANIQLLLDCEYREMNYLEFVDLIQKSNFTK